MVMTRRRVPECVDDEELDTPCPRADDQGVVAAKDGVIRKTLREALARDRVRLSDTDLERLASHIQRATFVWDAVNRRWEKSRLKRDDIIRRIIEARDGGDHDEAVWRAFLAAHFGRDSADPKVEREVMSASRVLDAFGSRPVWTWAEVSRRPKTFYKWLFDHRVELQTLSFGNHRQREAKKPEQMCQVFEFFIELARKHGGRPMSILTDDLHDEISLEKKFDVLYHRLETSLFRFGRTGVFDFLCLLADLNLIDATPGSCYLKGSSGPLEGARRVWGRNRPVRELDRLAADLARRLGLSPIVIEDALCNWQK